MKITPGPLAPISIPKRKMKPRSYSRRILMDAAARIRRKTIKKKIAGEIPVIKGITLSPFQYCNSDAASHHKPNRRILTKTAYSSHVDWHYRGTGAIYSPIVIELTPRCLAPGIDIRNYSTFSDNVNVSRLRGEGT